MSAKDMIENFRPEKFPALAALMGERNMDDLTALEQTVVFSANVFRAAAETSAAELAAMQTAIEAAREELKAVIAAANRRTGSPYTMLDDVAKHAHVALAELDKVLK